MPSAIISRWLPARTGHLARWPLLIPASYNTTFSIRPHSTSALAVESPRLHHRKQRKLSWPEFLKQQPTSIEEIQTVYDACVQSRIFSPIPERPIKFEGGTNLGAQKRVQGSNLRSLSINFRGVSGLKPEDWKARGIQFSHAVILARQLYLNKYFSHKPLSSLLNNWSRVVAEAQVGASAAGPSEGHANASTANLIFQSWNIEDWKSVVHEAQSPRLDIHGQLKKRGRDVHPAAREALWLRRQAKQAHGTPEGGSDAEDIESAQADRARRGEKLRKKAELASDAEEGIKSKRRPLRIVPILSNSKLPFPDSMKEKRGEKRVQRGVREVTVDDGVKVRVKDLRKPRLSPRAQKKKEQREEARRPKRRGRETSVGKDKE